MWQAFFAACDAMLSCAGRILSCGHGPYAGIPTTFIEVPRAISDRAAAAVGQMHVQYCHSHRKGKTFSSAAEAVAHGGGQERNAYERFVVNRGNAAKHAGMSIGPLSLEAAIANRKTVARQKRLLHWAFKKWGNSRAITSPCVAIESFSVADETCDRSAQTIEAFPSVAILAQVTLSSKLCFVLLLGLVRWWRYFPLNLLLPGRLVRLAGVTVTVLCICLLLLVVCVVARVSFFVFAFHRAMAYGKKVTNDHKRSVFETLSGCLVCGWTEVHLQAAGGLELRLEGVLRNRTPALRKLTAQKKDCGGFATTCAPRGPNGSAAKAQGS